MVTPRRRGIPAALSCRPDLAEPLADLLDALRRGPVEPELIDACEALVRHRVGVPVDRPVPDAGARDLDPRTRAVLVLAEQLVVDPHGIDTTMRDTVLDHCSLAELATIVQACAVFDALARVDAVMAEPGAPDARRPEGGGAA